MPATKKKSFRKVEPEAVTPIGKTIPQEILESFASVPHQYKIDAINITGNKWRLNYWSKHFEEGRVVPTNRITKSFYVRYESGIVYDETVPAKLTLSTI
jgi:pyruvate/2-oxoglutarate dehydrogenase complex dihydrolipoamide acyltransferase (E2) component